MLIEKEKELQALIQKLGPEARKWIDNNQEDTEPLHDPAKLSVPGASRPNLSSVAGNGNSQFLTLLTEFLDVPRQVISVPLSNVFRARCCLNFSKVLHN